MLLGPVGLGIVFCGFSWASVQLTPVEIIRRSVQANDRDWRMGPSYSHIERDADQKGDDRTDRTYEVFLMDGSTYRRLLAINGRPLPPAQQRQEQIKEQRELARRRSESPSERESRVRKYEADREHDHVLMTQMAMALTFRLVGQADVNGHPTYVLDAEPKPGYRPVNRDARVLTGMRGKLWVDSEHFHWVKVEAEVFHPVTFGGFIAHVDPGTRFQLSKEPVGNDVWQPMNFSMHVVASVLFFSHNSNSTQRFKDYRAGGAVSLLLPWPITPASPGGALPGPLSAIGNRANP